MTATRSRPTRTHPIPPIPIATIALTAALTLFAPATAQDQSGATADRKISTANGLLERGLDDLAEAEYRGFLTAYPEHSRIDLAQYGLTVALFRQHQHEEALAAITALELQPEFAYAPDVALIAARCRLALGRANAGATALAKAQTSLPPEHDLADDAASLLTELLFRANRFEEAAEAGHRMNQTWPKSAQRERTLLFQSLALIELDRHTPAAEVLGALRRSFPRGIHTAQAELLHAQSLHRSGATREAEREYTAVLQRAEPAWLPAGLYGRAHLRYPERPELAASDLDALIQAFPHHSLLTDAQFLRGRIDYDAGRWESAAAFFRAARTKAGPRQAEATWWQGRCALAADQPHIAQSILGRAVDQFEQSPLRAEMQYDLAVALHRMNRADAALEQLDLFLLRYGEHPLAPDALYLATLLDQESGRHSAVRDRAQQYADSYGQTANRSAVDFLAAESAFLTGEYDAALELWTRFLTEHPGNERQPEALFRFGLTLYHLDRFEDAETALSQVAARAKSDPRFATATLALGEIAFQNQSWSDAARWLEPYLPFAAPDERPSVMLKLALALRHQGQIDAAIRRLQILRQAFPDSESTAHATFELGQTYVQADRPVEAQNAFKSLLEESPDCDWTSAAHHHLGAIAHAAGDFERASSHFSRAAEEDQSGGATARFQQAQSLLSAGRFSEAEAVLVSLLEGSEAGPTSDRPAALAQLTIARSRLGSHAAALDAAALLSASDHRDLDDALRSRLLYEIAWCHRSSQNLDAAAASYMELIQDSGAGELAAHARLELAELESARGNDALATSLLETLARTDAPDDPDNPDETAALPLSLQKQARYRYGAGAYRLKEWAAAADRLEAYANSFPDDPLAASARLLAAEACLTLGATRRAEKLLIANTREASAPPADGRTDHYGLSLLRLAECRATHQHWPASVTTYKQFLTARPKSPLGYQARFGIAWGLENQGRTKDAIAAYQVVTAQHDGATAARAQFQIGECLFAEKRYDEAIRALLQVDIVYAYPEWSSAALYEAGRCFDSLGDRAQARHHFQLVVDQHGETEWATLARQQLDALSRSGLPAQP